MAVITTSLIADLTKMTGTAAHFDVPSVKKLIQLIADNEEKVAVYKSMAKPHKKSNLSYKYQIFMSKSRECALKAKVARDKFVLFHNVYVHIHHNEADSDNEA